MFMNYLELLIQRNIVMDKLNELINVVDNGTREGLTDDDIEFMRTLVVDLNASKSRILKIYADRRIP